MRLYATQTKALYCVPEAWKLCVHLAVALGKGGVGKLVTVELHGRGQLQQLVLQSENKGGKVSFCINRMFY